MRKIDITENSNGRKIRKKIIKSFHKLKKIKNK